MVYLSLNITEEAEFDREVASIKKETEKEKVMQIVTSWMERGVALFYHSQNSKIVRNYHKCYPESDCERFYC